MTDLYRSIHIFETSFPHLRTSLAGEDLMLTRIAGTAGDALALTTPNEDAFALVFQLGQVPAHLMSHDSQVFDIPSGPAHAVTAVDLAGPVVARVAGAFDSLNFRISRAALDIFADQAASPRVSRLHLPGDAFSNVDPVIAGLSATLVDTMRLHRSRSLFADHLLLSLMAHALSRYGDGPRATARVGGGLAPWQERRAREMLDPGSGSAPTLSDVAGACRVSVAHFSRAFKLSVGMPPWTWHQARRVDHARTLLRDGALPLAQVAAATGFADQSHFTRVFAKQVGRSPGQWRRDRGIH